VCRVFAYAGPPTDLSPYLSEGPRSLRALACEHPDGWGFAQWSAAGETAWTVKSPGNAEKDPEFRRAGRTRSPRVLAHIRHASVGGAGLPNTHPFAAGPWAFAHNGTLRGFDHAAAVRRLDPDLQRLCGGTTDSEAAFVAFLQGLRAWGLGADASLEEAAPVLAAFARDRAAGTEEGKVATVNFYAGNGEGFLATRFGKGLFVRQGPGFAMLASEPMGADSDWREVPERSLLLLRPGRSEVRPIA
jgi:glutamine amidotransferase